MNNSPSSILPRGRLSGLRALFGDPLKEREPDEALTSHIRAEQIAAIVRLTPVTMLANAVNAGIVAFAMWGEGYDLFLAGWTALLAVLITLSFAGWLHSQRHPRRQTATAKALSRVILYACLLAVTWSLVPLILFPEANSQQQLLIASLSAGMIGGGAFAMATVRAAAFSYVLILTATCALALELARFPMTQLMVFLLASYAVIVLSSASAHARVFVLRLADQAELERQSHVIGLLLRDFEESASDWLWETDRKGVLVHVSRRFAELVGCEARALRGTSFLHILGGPSTPVYLSTPDGDFRPVTDVESLFNTRQPFGDVFISVMADGDYRWWCLTAKPILNPDGRFIGYRGVGADVTAAKQAELKIAHMAMHDVVTGLPNRAYFREALEQALDRSRRYKSSFAVQLVDLDRFKAVNDTLGHPAGDTVLEEVAQRLRGIARESDVIVRLGGDEFAILQCEAHSEGEVAALARRIVDTISEPYTVNGAQVVIGASIGIALAPRDGSDADQLMRHADLALYRSKSDGRGTYCFFVAEMDHQAQARRILELDLREALAQRQLSLHFQPIVNIKSGQVSGFEALLRWRHPDRGMISPAEFIPVAEETGLIQAVGEWVIHEACREAASWPAPLKVAVNLSPSQFRNRQLVDIIQQALTTSGLPPERLEIEITESLLLEDNDAVLHMLSALREKGVRISLDDFGTGFSSLGYLRSFPFTKIKIDQSFIRDVATRNDSAAIVRAVTGLANSLGMVTTAEGVETSEQLDALRGFDCVEVQGYLFSRPVPAQDIRHLILNWQAHRRILAA
ncbi:putative bifunctional diguanylate cyclase/phosphodiesterase [Parapedomonas caeni]